MIERLSRIVSIPIVIALVGTLSGLPKAGAFASLVD